MKTDKPEPAGHPPSALNVVSSAYSSAGADRLAVYAIECARRAEFWSLPDHALVDRDTVAAVRYVKRQTIEGEAIKGGGVPYRRIGRRALSTKADVLRWIEAHSAVVANTAQAAQKAAA